jgi:hypothetical protein
MQAGSLFSAIKVVLLMSVMFYGGLTYGRYEDRVVYKYPDAPYYGVGRLTPQPEASAPPVSFNAVPRSPEALTAARAALERKIFGGPRDHALPSILPLDYVQFTTDYVGRAAFDEHYRGIFTAQQIKIDEIAATFDELQGYTWKSLLLQQHLPSSRLVIFHQGHDGNPFDFDRSNQILGQMIADGFDVLVMCMPGVGWNGLNDVRIKTWDGGGYLSGSHKNSHALFAMIDTGDAHFIKYFIAPVLSSLDAALGRRTYTSVLMAGHSGGGWTTTLAAALDTRIDYSISYGGTLPFFAKHQHGDLGDAEQYDSAFYRDFPYPALYELASSDSRKHRIHYQIYNTKDHCCFAQESTATLKRYLDQRSASPNSDLRITIVESDTHDMRINVLVDTIRQIGTAEAMRR